MTHVQPGAPPPVPTRDELDARIAAESAAGPRYADRFLNVEGSIGGRPRDERDVAVVLEWLAANAVEGTLADPPDVVVDYTELTAPRLGYRALNAAGTGTEIGTVPLLKPPTPAVTGALHRLRATLTEVGNDPVGPPPGSQRPRLSRLAAAIYDEWLVPNGIDEWVPESTGFVVDETAGTITYSGFEWPDGESRWSHEFLIEGEGATAHAALRERVAPLKAPVTERVAALFAASGTLHLIESHNLNE